MIIMYLSWQAMEAGFCFFALFANNQNGEFFSLETLFDVP